MLLATGPRAEGTGVQEAGSGPASEQEMPGPVACALEGPRKEEGGLGRAEASRQNARAGEGAAGGGGAEED